MTQLRKAAILIAAVVTLLLAGSPNAQAAPASRHHGHFWVWFGPRSWDAVYSKQGITVSSPSGHDVLDLGFSSIFCSPGNTYADSVANHYRAARRNNLPGNATITDRTPVAHPRGTSGMYRRQVLEVRFTHRGVNYRGQYTFDYDFQTNVDGLNYCYARNLAKYAPAGRWTDSRRTLNQIQASLAYSGPGVADEDPTDP